MKIDCQLIAVPLSSEWKDSVFVVVDVLRATSTIVTAFMNGCKSIVPVAEVGEAFDLAKGPMAGVLVGGERGGRTVEGFDLGNSPQEYTPARVRGQTIILTTTNGSRAFRTLREDAIGIVGSFLNMRAVARYCIRRGRDVLFVLSGQEGEFSLEDAVCAGGIVGMIRKQLEDEAQLSDAALASEILYDHFRGNLVEMFRTSVWGRHLIEIGAEEDLPYCAQIDITAIVPVYRDGKIELSAKLWRRG